MGQGSDRIAFTKMSGAGNDFVLINGEATALPSDPGVLTGKLCRRGVSVGADGLVLVERSERADADVRVRFWNPDGAEVGTCGNGTRCAARFAVAEGLAPHEMRIETADGDIGARVDGATVALRYSVRPRYELERTVTGGAGPQRGHYVDIGNPHFVIPMETLPQDAIEPFCRPLRSAPELGAAGVNVHLVQILDRHGIRIRTYERGVEAETLACGSGSLSSALALAAAGQVESPVRVETRSGEVLTIRFERDGDGGFTDLELEGPAREVYRAELSPEASD